MSGCHQAIAPMLGMMITITVLVITCSCLLLYIFNTVHPMIRNTTVTNGSDQDVKDNSAGHAPLDS